MRCATSFETWRHRQKRRLPNTIGPPSIEPAGKSAVPILGQVGNDTVWPFAELIRIDFQRVPLNNIEPGGIGLGNFLERRNEAIIGLNDVNFSRPFYQQAARQSAWAEANFNNFTIGQITR